MRPIAVIFSLAVCGCAGSNGQLTTCQAEKEQLLTTIRTQRDDNRVLSDKVVSLESRLDQAEKQIAQGRPAARLSQAPEKSPPTTARAASLPWRAPDAATSESSASKATNPGVNARAKLQQLAHQDGRVKLDARRGTGRIELPLAFRDQSASLTAEDKVQLDQVAQLLKSDDARNLDIVVADDHPARAQAVADYLDRHGIARQRLLIGNDRTTKGSENYVQLDVRSPGATTATQPAVEMRRR